MRFFKNVVRIGVPFGIAFSLSAGLVSPSRLAHVLIAIAAAAIQGSLGAAAVHRLSPRKRWYHHLMIGAVLGFGGLVLGSVLWILVLPGYRLPHGRWRRLPDPPEPVADIIGHSPWKLHEGGKLFVRSVSGAVYEAHDDGEKTITWALTAAVPPQEPAASPDSDEYAPERSYATPIPPGRIIGEDVIHVRSSESGAQINYILLQNGSLWRVYYPWGAMLIFVMALVGIGFATLLGLLEGIVSPWFIVRRPSQQNMLGRCQLEES